MATQSLPWASGKRKRAPGRTRQTKRRRLPRIRSRKHGVLAAVWSIVTSVFVIAWLTLGGVLWMAAALIGALATAITVIATFDPDSAVPDQPKRRPASASPRGNGSARPRRSTSGTPRKKTAPSKPRKRVCSVRCRTSKESVATCQCVCGGKTHGKGAVSGGQN